MIFPREPLTICIHPPYDSERHGLVYLESPCESCNGKGENEELRYSGYDRTCNACEGSGVVLNDNGRAVLELVTTYLKSKDSNVLIAQRIM